MFPFYNIYLILLAVTYNLDRKQLWPLAPVWFSKPGVYIPSDLLYICVNVFPICSLLLTLVPHTDEIRGVESGSIGSRG